MHCVNFRERIPLRNPTLLFFCLFFATAVAHADPLQVVFELPFNHAALHALAERMEAPNPPNPLTADQIRQQTSTMSDTDYNTLKFAINYLTPGFKVVQETASRHYLIVQIDLPGNWAQGIFNATQSSASLNTVFRNQVVAKLPYYVQSFITSVLNPSTAPKLVPHLSKVVARLKKLPRDSGTGPNGYDPNAGAAPAAGIPSGVVYTEADLPGVRPSTLRTWYGIDVLRQKYGLTGAGQNIATLAFGHVDANRVMNVYNPIALITNQPPIEVNGANTEIKGGTYDTSGDETENEVDLEMAGNVAPGAALHSFVGGAASTLVEWVQNIDQILDDPRRIRIISSSYGFTEGQGQAASACEPQAGIPDATDFMDPLFDRAVAQGVTYLNASGDDGSDSCQNGTVSVQWPTTPEALQVGATQAAFGNFPGSVTPDYQDIAEEIGWSLSTGGVSILYPQPFWMKSPVAGIAANISMHAIPDVAMYGDHIIGQPVYTVNVFGTNPDPDQPMWTTLGGTSLAAPAMAGFLALVNEARALPQNGSKPPLPYVTPLLYRLQLTTDGAHPYAYSNAIRDIVHGNNGKNGKYDAGKGWDMLTGLGSIQGEALLNYLVSQ